ncbi:MAG: PQQ-like beta-propeller repeat protein [Acidobacteriota bacterium]|nr:PQQ-like beta-propeller repeat protein [Acidobacteriota bacterium]
MIRKLLKAGLILVVVLAASAGVLYLLGVRMVMDGGAGIHFGFVKSGEAQADEIARHREAQRAQAPIPAAEGSLPAATAAPAGPNEPASPAQPVSSASPASPAASDWPDFRGPARDGHYRAAPIRTDWPATGLTPMWKQPVGGGYASFVTAGGHAFTIEQRAGEEVVAAYDVMTGRELWTSSWTARFSETMGGDGPRATPTWAAGRVYALGGEGELRALDARDGRMLWRTNILADAGAENRPWGMSGSPLIVDNTVVVTPGGAGGKSLIAYDAASGRQAWSALDDRTSYSSPMLVTVGGVRQILYFTSSRLVALTPDGGRELWSHPWVTDPAVNASQPLFIGDNRIFISTGYGKGATVIELTRAGEAFTVREVWRNIRMKNQFTSSVLHEGFIYGLDEAILACIDAATGEVKWKGGRYGYGQLMLADGHLIVMTEGGDMALVRATPAKHEEVSRFTVFDARTWNHPAITNGILLVRNLQEMAAFDLRAAAR